MIRFSRRLINNDLVSCVGREYLKRLHWYRDAWKKIIGIDWKQPMIYTANGRCKNERRRMPERQFDLRFIRLVYVRLMASRTRFLLHASTISAPTILGLFISWLYLRKTISFSCFLPLTNMHDQFARYVRSWSVGNFSTCRILRYCIVIFHRFRGTNTKFYFTIHLSRCLSIRVRSTFRICLEGI